jgi:hypothetical protein
MRRRRTGQGEKTTRLADHFAEIAQIAVAADQVQ